MPRVPDPVTSPPEQPFQPYDAQAPGGGDAQSDSAAVYAAAGGGAGGDPWVKIQDGGAADFRTGRITGDWPGDGASDGSAWKQT
jgi:hypothetical protein